MLKKRLVVTLLWRHMGLVQSRGFVHTNMVGDPKVAIECFNAWDADEIVLLNVERNDDAGQFLKVVEYVSYHCFLPLTVGGWITTVERARTAVEHGADKLVINTAGFRRPKLFEETAALLGSQAVVAGIDVRGTAETEYKVYVDRGREPTSWTPEQAARLAVEHGAGEIFLTSIDRDGSLRGYDTELIRRVVDVVDVPVIAFGGVGSWEHLDEGLAAGAEAVAAGNIFHFTERSTRKAKLHLRKGPFPVR
jgi:cyclase